MRSKLALAVLLAACAGRQTPPPAPPPPPVEPAPPVEGAPWIAPPIAMGVVEQAYLTEWSHARNKERCPLIVATELGGVGGASARRADFGEGWGVAYDAPGVPGVDAAGKACDTCGRSAFGVAATATSRTSASRWPQETTWPDGSRAVRQRAESGWYVAYLEVHGVDCLYYVWSTISDQHLLGLLHGLRRVEGI